MTKYSSEGVITGLSDMGEADRLVSIFTPLGPLTAIAKQARWSVRRFGGRLDLFNRISFDYSRKEPDAPAILDETELLERFPGISRDAELFGFAAAFGQVVMGAWGENEPADELYAFFVEYLRRMDKGHADTHRQFLDAVKLLALLGNAPSLDGCASCGKAIERKGALHYSAIEGGIVCGDCLPQIRRRDERGGVPTLDVDTQTITTLDAATNSSPAKLGRLKFSKKGLAEARKIWFSHVRALLGRTPASIEYIEKIES